MKIKKLPDLHIKNALTSPTVEIKLDNFRRVLKIVGIVLLMFFLLGGMFFLNLKNEERIIFNNRVQVEQSNAINKKSGVLFDATSDIIQREGKVPPSVAKQYAVWIYESAAKFAVDPMLILSVISIESNFNYKAISPTGPVGLMQIASSHHKDKATPAELFSPETNISVGTQIIKEYADRSSSLVETLLRYNGSLGSAPVYATKVIATKNRFEKEIMGAIGI